MSTEQHDGRKADAVHNGGFAIARRKNERKPIALGVEIRENNGTVSRGRTANLSIGGAFIVTPSPAAYGAAVTLVVDVPGYPSGAVIEAIVRWSDSSGMGVQFGPMGAKLTNALIELLRR
jgi:hypothetical protein